MTRRGLPPQDVGERELASAWRVLSRFGLVDTVFNHISLAIASGASRPRFLINRFGVMPDVASPRDFVPIEQRGSRRERGAVNADGLRLHAAIHRRREGRTTAVVHLHSMNVIAVGASKRGLLPVSQTGMEFVADLLYVEYEGLLHGTPRAVDTLARRVVDGGLVLLRNHGSLIVADTVAEAVYCAYYLEQACRQQVQLLSHCSVDDTVLPPDEVVARTARKLRAERSRVARLFFEAAAVTVRACI